MAKRLWKEGMGLYEINALEMTPTAFEELRSALGQDADGSVGLRPAKWW